MKNIGKLLGLDVKLIKPYWKWCVLFLAIALFFSVINRDGAVFIVVFAMLSASVMAFPFEFTCKSNLNVLYATLPTNRKTLLVARFGFMLVTLVLMLVISVATSLVIDLIFGNEISWRMMAFFVCVAFGMFLVMTGFQTPFFYKFGYAKGRIFMWIPTVLIIVALNLPLLFSLLPGEIEFNIFEWAFGNVNLAKAVAVASGLVVFVISYLVSRRIYLRKDF